MKLICPTVCLLNKERFVHLLSRMSKKYAYRHGERKTSLTYTATLVSSKCKVIVTHSNSAPALTLHGPKQN